MLDKKRSSTFRYLYSQGIFDLPLRLWLEFKTDIKPLQTKSNHKLLSINLIIVVIIMISFIHNLVRIFTDEY